MRPLRDLTASTDPIDAVWPGDLIGPFVPVGESDIDVFNEILGDEIDSDFASSICCCDLCYADFKRHWPNTAFRESEFQELTFDTLYLLENSRVPGLYSEGEMSTLRHFVRCERCAGFPHRVWIYEHRFSDAREIEEAIDELLTIGNRTPFLLLEHHFAVRVLEQIRRWAEVRPVLAVGVSLFRARTEADIARCGQSLTDLETFGPAPAAHVGEGRFNHAGAPMLYLASTPELAAAEIGRPGEACAIGELTISAGMRVLDLVDIEEGEDGWDIMKALSASALLAAPHSGEGWLKRQYVFSRFVADCARSAGFDAIRYGSTKLVEGENYVLLDPCSIETIAALVGHRHLAGVVADTRY